MGSAEKLTILGGLSASEFLSTYWQKKPLLIRKALHPLPELLTPDELAGLSTEKEIDSRLILEKGGKSPWELRRGPFEDADFSSLPPTHWTLLVNGVDRRVPEIQALFKHFSVLPQWRLDDIMVSYATLHGNVGAHIDNFDVFLIQGLGKREWRIGNEPILEDDFVPNMPVKLLREFVPTDTWVLEEGDMLYLPPRFAHHGVSVSGECMTYSVGFRAPTMGELYDSYATEVLSLIPDTLRYGDPDLKPQHTGLITAETVDRVVELITTCQLSHDRASEWFGRFVTRRSEEPEELEALEEKQVAKMMNGDFLLRRNEATRLAFTVEHDGEVMLFCNGEQFDIGATEHARKFCEFITEQIEFRTEALRHFFTDDIISALMKEQIAQGAFYFVEEEDE